MLRILLLSDFTSEYSRLMLRGFLRYSKEVGGWSFYRIPLSQDDRYENTVIKIAQKWGADAIIGQISNVNIQRLKSIGIPIIIQNYTDRVSGISNITGDYWGTGIMAANYFLKKRYKNFAFYGTRTTVWSREREDGFREKITESGHNLICYNEEYNIRYGSTSDLTALGKWLQELPKPIALFACDDAFALRITEVCCLNNIRVPEDIAVLGVDNDEILCNMSDPPLSSIVLDVENGGYQAACHLHQIINNRDLPQFNITINPIRIERRKSTEGYAIDDPLVLSTIRMIEDDNNRQITIKEILGQVHVSRRVLEKRFKSTVGESIYQYILKQRLSWFAEKLITSDKSVSEVAFDLGYEDYINLSKAFKRIYNITPTQYRNHYCIQK
ncbi:DNA-binding transcriptional regulator [Bacteroides sp. 51]|uniref:DNA-binding transcriptional regulator n=1 Tax=Bacteroides sp. 51 TaxID=2302938 RepID=UPI0013CF4E28|nr:DNA-binding transcriptional regulator [Bacteroides sp. 51]NDV82478.1 helix-turn-helix domain-containing protein [Bacteroides sp. 51]